MNATGQGYASRQRATPGHDVAVIRSLPVCGEDSTRRKSRPARDATGSRDYEVLRIRPMPGGERLDSPAEDQSRPQNWRVTP